MDGRCLSKFSAYQYALGVKAVSWSWTSQFLAIGSYDQRVRLLNNISWKMIGDFTHTPSVETSTTLVVYREVEKRLPTLPTEPAMLPTSLFRNESKYEVAEGVIKFSLVKPDCDKPNPKVGVGLVAFSHDSQYMATRNDNMPTVLWIWEVLKLRLAVVLIHSLPIRCIEWDPCQPRIALCTGNNRIYMWSPAGCITVNVPNDALFNVLSLRWAPTGDTLALIAKDQFCVCYLTNRHN